MANQGITNIGTSGKTKYPSSFYNYTTKNTIKLHRINKPILQFWIQNEIVTILGFDDEIVINTVINLFGLSTSNSDTTNNDSNTSQEMIDPKQAHVILSGFFNNDENVALKFCVTLWEYMIDASQQSNGIPQAIIAAKKRQLLQTEQKLQNESTVTTSVMPNAPSQREPHPSTNNENQEYPRKRRNRWDNNNSVAAVIIPPEERRRNDTTTSTTGKETTHVDEYGRSTSNNERQQGERYNMSTTTRKSTPDNDRDNHYHHRRHHHHYDDTEDDNHRHKRKNDDGYESNAKYRHSRYDHVDRSQYERQRQRSRSHYQRDIDSDDNKRHEKRKGQN